MELYKVKSKHRPIRQFTVNQWPASPPRFVGVMPVIIDPGAFDAIMAVAKQRPLEWIEIVQATRIGAN